MPAAEPTGLHSCAGWLEQSQTIPTNRLNICRKSASLAAYGYSRRENSGSSAVPGRRDERDREEEPTEGLRTRCCQTGTLILAPLLISSVTEGKSLNPSGFSLHQCSPEASSVYWPQQTLNADSECNAPLLPAGRGSAEHWVAGCYRPGTGRALSMRVGDLAERNQCGVSKPPSA